MENIQAGKKTQVFNQGGSRGILQEINPESLKIVPVDKSPPCGMLDRVLHWLKIQGVKLGEPQEIVRQYQETQKRKINGVKNPCELQIPRFVHKRVRS